MHKPSSYQELKFVINFPLIEKPPNKKKRRKRKRKKENIHSLTWKHSPQKN
jgi:hypothetical protein